MQPTSPTKRPLRVLYIAGSGRSGSTVLSTILGNDPEVVNLGELERLPDDGWRKNRYCSCGERAGECPFWSDVRRRWADAAPGADVDEYLALQERFTARRSIARYLTPGTLGGDGDRFGRYGELTRALLQSILEVSDAGIAVDSTKRPTRALALARIPGIDLRILHLVRDGRGVLWSLKQSHEKNEEEGVERPIRPKPTWRVAGLWTYANLLTEYACSRLGNENSARLRYEHLVEDPSSALGLVGEVANRDLSALGARASSGGSFDVGHAIAGNRVRMQKSISLRADRTWRQRLAGRDRRVFWLLTWFLMRRYGYRRSG